jgi:hypothetical protein
MKMMTMKMMRMAMIIFENRVVISQAYIVFVLHNDDYDDDDDDDNNDNDDYDDDDDD